MRTIILVSFMVVLTTSTSLAQNETTYGFDKGDFILSGTVSYVNRSSESIRNNNEFTNISNNFAIIPEVGYFLSNHFMIGARVGYLTGKSQSLSSNSGGLSNDVIRGVSSGYRTGVLGRYYINPKSRVSFFTELDASYGKTDSESSRTNLDNVPSVGEDEREDYSVVFTPGINIFLNKNLSLTSRIGSVGYSKSKSTFTDFNDNSRSTNEGSAFLANIGLDNFFFGIAYRI